MFIADRFRQLRGESGLSQDDIATALGVSRAMISYWESGKRIPSDRQVEGLARLLGTDVGDLLGLVDRGAEPNVARMFFRTATEVVSPGARAGISEFVDLLDAYGKISDITGISIHGLRQSPFLNRREFDTLDDARRKAEEVRSYLRIGLGPIVDIDAVCEMLGITAFRAPLGEDLSGTISGAFYKHRAVGFAILVNVQMTPGRRRFTVAHEIAHALFHSDDETAFVISGPRTDARERFANAFAGEFLMPAEAIRRLMEEEDFGPRITDVADVIRIQRYFRVSYVMTLVRLRQARVIGLEAFKRFQEERPVVVAQSLGYETDPDEYHQDPARWRMARYPSRFLRMVREAIANDLISVPTAASLTGLTQDEIEELLVDSLQGIGQHKQELDEFLASGVLSGD